MSGHTPGAPFGIPSPLAYPPYPAFTTWDLFLLSVAVWIVFGILWLILYLPFRVLPTTLVLITITGLLLLATPFEPWLFVATLGGGVIGYIKARRQPAPVHSRLVRALFGWPPLDDVAFDYWTSHVLDVARSSVYREYLRSRMGPWPDKLYSRSLVLSCEMYRHSVTWSLISASCFFFVYSLAYLTMPLGLQVLVVVFMAAVCSMQVGMLAKRRSAEKQIARMEGEVF